MSISRLDLLSTDLKKVIHSYLDLPASLFYSRAHRSHPFTLNRKKIYRRRIEREPIKYFSYFIHHIHEYENAVTLRQCIAEIATDIMNEPNSASILKIISKMFLLANQSLSLSDNASFEIFKRQANEIVTYAGYDSNFYKMFHTLISKWLIPVTNETPQIDPSAIGFSLHSLKFQIGYIPNHGDFVQGQLTTLAQHSETELASQIISSEFLTHVFPLIDELHDPNLVKAYLSNLFACYRRVLMQDRDFPTLIRINKFHEMANYLESLKKQVVISNFEHLLTDVTALFLKPVEFPRHSDNTHIYNRMLLALSLYVPLSSLVLQDEYSYNNDVKVAKRILWYLDENNNLDARDGYCNYLLSYLNKILIRLRSSSFGSVNEISALALQVFTHLISAPNYESEVRLADFYSCQQFESIYEHISPFLLLLTSEDREGLTSRLYEGYTRFHYLKSLVWIFEWTWIEFRVIQMLLSDLAPALDINQLRHLIFTMPVIMSQAREENSEFDLINQPLFFVEKVVACLPKDYDCREAVKLSYELFELQKYQTNSVLRSLYNKYNIIVMLTYLDHTKPQFLGELIQIILSDSFLPYLCGKHFLPYFAAIFSKLPTELRKNIIDSQVAIITSEHRLAPPGYFAIGFINKVATLLTKDEIDIVIVDLVKINGFSIYTCKEVIDTLIAFKPKLDTTQLETIFNALIKGIFVNESYKLIAILEARFLSHEKESAYLAASSSQIQSHCHLWAAPSINVLLDKAKQEQVAKRQRRV